MKKKVSAEEAEELISSIDVGSGDCYHDRDFSIAFGKVVQVDYFKVGFDLFQDTPSTVVMIIDDQRFDKNGKCQRKTYEKLLSGLVPKDFNESFTESDMEEMAKKNVISVDSVSDLCELGPNPMNSKASLEYIKSVSSDVNEIV